MRTTTVLPIVLCYVLFCYYNWFSSVDAFLLVLPPPTRTSTFSSLSQPASASASASASELLGGGLPMTTTDKNAKDTSFRLAYITDVEGNLDYFLRFVEQSNVLNFKEDPTTTSTTKKETVLLELCQHCYFVYGGDAVDKGPGDIRLVRLLVNLKRRYPDRVFLLVGNRDLNKLRFKAELSDFDMQTHYYDIPPPHWDPKAPSLATYLKDKLDASSSTNATSLDELNTRVNRLHYLLEHTLGCPKTFEFRRQELAILNHKSEDHNISDDDVVQSFLYEVEDPEGSLRQYLEHANVAVCIGNTLFCHGAVDRQTMQFVPHVNTKFENPTSQPAPGALVTNVHEWTDALNDYLHQGLLDYQNRPYWNANRTSRGGESLMALQNRPAMWGRSIVSNCYGDGGCITTDHAAEIRNDPTRKGLETTDPLSFEKVSSDPRDVLVADWLRKDGIQRVVVGHKPTGDCPAVLSALYTGVEIVSADTSFSDTKATDNRGAAMGMVEIVGQSSTDNHLELSGTLQDGSNYFSEHIRLHSSGCDESVGDANLGMQIDGGWWIKAATTATTVDGEEYYHLTKGSGRHVEYKKSSLAQVNTEVVAITRQLLQNIKHDRV